MCILLVLSVGGLIFGIVVGERCRKLDGQYVFEHRGCEIQCVNEMEESERERWEEMLEEDADLTMRGDQEENKEDCERWLKKKTIQIGRAVDVTTGVAMGAVIFLWSLLLIKKTSSKSE
jgi:hydrogenase maturation factor